MHEDRFAATALDRALERLQATAPALTRLSHVLLVLCTAALGLLDLVIGAGGVWVMPRYWPAAALVLAGASVAAVVQRQRRTAPALAGLCLLSIAVTAVALASTESGPPSFAVLFAIALLGARVVRREQGRVALALALLGAVAVAAEMVRIDEAGAATLVVLGEVCFFLAVGAGLYRRWTDWRRLAAEAAARSDERLEIARELHDLVGHYVTGMVVQAQAARHVADRDPAAASAALERIEAAGGEAMTAMRRMVGGLRDDTPRAPGADWDDLERLVDAAAAEGVPARLQMDPDVRSLSADLAASTYRIVTESLTNVRRHARDATRVEVEVEVDHALLRIRVADDGSPGVVSSNGTYGLIGMRERADALGGMLYAGPAPTRGWLVLAELPLEGAR